MLSRSDYLNTAACMLLLFYLIIACFVRAKPLHFSMLFFTFEHTNYVFEHGFLSFNNLFVSAGGEFCLIIVLLFQQYFLCLITSFWLSGFFCCF